MTTVTLKNTPAKESGVMLRKEISETLIGPNHDKVKIAYIESTSDFKALRHDWNKLVAESINPHPFILWEWMYTWWETYHSQGNKKLAIIALYNSDELVAIAPFYMKLQGNLIKTLCLLGEGEEEFGSVFTAYPDIIVKEKYKNQVIDILSKQLLTPNNSSLQFHTASFNFIHENSILQAIGEHLSSQFVSLKYHSENQFLIKLPDNEDEYLASLSKSTRKQFRMKFNRIQKAGDIELSAEKDLKKGLEIVESLHRARWNLSEDDNAFNSDFFKRFHNKLCAQFQQQDIMQIKVMRHNDTPIAAAYNFKYQNTCYSYLSGFKSEDDKRFSPMFIFDILEIKNLISHGYNRYDLLVSESQNNYKKKFGSEVNSVYKIHWLKKGFISTAMISYLKIRPFLAKVYHLFSK